MPVNLVQYRGAVGNFHNRKCFNTKVVNKVFGHRYWMPTNSGTVFLLLLITLCAVLHKSSKTSKNISVGILLFIILLNLELPFLSILIMLCSDVEINPGLKTISQQGFSICHWNLNSIIAHNFAKIFLLKAYVATHKFDIICLPETYLDSSIPTNNDNLDIGGYNLLRSDHPSITKRGGVCIYYKNYLPLRVININYLNECIVFDIKLGYKIGSFLVLYRSPSQSSDEFESFSKNLELTLDRVMKNTPYMMVLLGDFHAKCTNWYKHDKTNFEGIAIENISSQCGLDQVINEPTHILENFLSCIDLIFTSQPNLITESGVHPSLHPNCHHQVIYAKFNLKVYYPPPYERDVWHHKEAGTDLIRRSIEIFNWDRAFKNSDVNDMVDIFPKTIYNILSNFIPHQTITIDDKDPPWFNTNIKSLPQEKNKIYKNFRKDRNYTQLLRKLEHLQNRLNNSIDSSKHNYYLRMANKLNSIQKSSKAYWSLLKSFLNNKKIPVIPPILHNNALVTDFKKKAELFNSHFANQCTSINNNSTLPVNVQYLTEKRLFSFDFSEDDIMKVIQKLDPNKAHGQDNISIRMIKICGKSICIPLRKIFEECLRTGTFPLEWKKGNVVPIFKKVDKEIYKNYRPVSLQPIFGKILERLIFEEMFPFFIENKLIAAN